MAQAHNRASDWFDGLYKNNKTTQENIPWAKRVVNPLLQTYIDENEHYKGKALVIGCGLGDDAKALEEAGYDVLAIDVSQTALDLAQARFEGSKIVFEKQDIFDMPAKYQEHFDFVFEAFTIQSLPVEFREKMIKAISHTLADKGELLVVAHQKNRAVQGPPWPLTQEEIDLFKTEGLTELSFEVFSIPGQVAPKQFRVLYSK